VWRSGGGGRVWLFTADSSQGNPGLKNGQAKHQDVVCTYGVEPTSSIDIMFDAWDLIAFAQQFKWIEEIDVRVEDNVDSLDKLPKAMSQSPIIEKRQYIQDPGVLKANRRVSSELSSNEDDFADTEIGFSDN
jgi:hypothetical protein